MQIVDTARAIALEAHAGTVNKHDGELYLLHVDRVAVGSRSQAYAFSLAPDLCEAVGWLHDVVEDTAWSVSDIKTRLTNAGCRNHEVDTVILAVATITKPRGGGFTLEEYYERLQLDPIAQAVKMADLLDNFSRNHKIEDEAKRLRMAKKYSLGMEMLKP